MGSPFRSPVKIKAHGDVRSQAPRDNPSTNLLWTHPSKIQHKKTRHLFQMTRFFNTETKTTDFNGLLDRPSSAQPPMLRRIPDLPP